MQLEGALPAFKKLKWEMIRMNSRWSTKNEPFDAGKRNISQGSQSYIDCEVGTRTDTSDEYPFRVDAILGSFRRSPLERCPAVTYGSRKCPVSSMSIVDIQNKKNQCSVRFADNEGLPSLGFQNGIHRRGKICREPGSHGSCLSLL